MADAAMTIKCEFDGYWREPNKGSLPAKAGVYCVYGCTYDEKAKKVNLAKLVYIGEAGDIKDRVANHDKLDAWKKQLSSGQILCYSAALLAPDTTRQRAEAALIFKHKPPVNTEYAHSFPFDTTTIETSGTTAKLVTPFTVKKDATD